MVRRHLGEIRVRKRTNLEPDIHGNLSKGLALQVSLYMCRKLLSPQRQKPYITFRPSSQPSSVSSQYTSVRQQTLVSQFYDF